MIGRGIEPIFPQQSIREMTRTGRSPKGVMHDALEGDAASRLGGDHRAPDADHPPRRRPTSRPRPPPGLPSSRSTRPTSSSPRARPGYDEPTLRSKFAAVAGEIGWLDDYRGRTVGLATGTTITLDEVACLRAAVKYGRALNHAIGLADHIASACNARGQGFEIELSVDETEQPTTLAEHYIIADRCLGRGMKLVSLAPRYIGDFEKGVDYKGDVAALERSLLDHAAIAGSLGPYKLSLHSGSDKLSIYGALARATEGRFHVKTAGTSYLEALRVVARHDERLFREVVDFARSRYDRDKATYHVSATLASAPPAGEVSDIVELERLYLELWPEVEPRGGFTRPGRQILHCTFGSVLTDPRLGPAVRAVVESNIGTYTEVLADHFGRHLDALDAGL